MKYQVILLAAGRGERSCLSYNKVFHKIGKKTIFEESIKHFLDDNDCEKIIVTYKENEVYEFQKLVTNKKVTYVLGGKTRQESVSNALQYIDSQYVLVHDAARPYFSIDLLKKIKKALNNFDCVIPVIDIKDTIKKVDNEKVVETVDRNLFKFVQTPQGFKTMDLIKAHQNALNNVYTDDSAMIEKILNKEVYIIPGEIGNYKYTNKEDFR